MQYHDLMRRVLNGRSGFALYTSQACQAAQDRDFLLATALPLAVAAGIALKKFRSPPNTRYLDPEQGSGLYISLDVSVKDLFYGPYVF